MTPLTYPECAVRPRVGEGVVRPELPLFHCPVPTALGISEPVSRCEGLSAFGPQRERCASCGSKGPANLQNIQEACTRNLIPLSFPTLRRNISLLTCPEKLCLPSSQCTRVRYLCMPLRPPTANLSQRPLQWDIHGTNTSSRWKGACGRCSGRSQNRSRRRRETCEPTRGAVCATSGNGEPHVRFEGPRNQLKL